MKMLLAGVVAVVLSLTGIISPSFVTQAEAASAVKVNFGPAGRSVNKGSTVQLSGTVKTLSGKPVSGHRVQVQRLFGSAWRKVKDVNTNKNGAFYVSYAPGATAKYRAVYAGSRDYRLTVSPVRTISVVVPVRPAFASYGVLSAKGKLIPARDVDSGKRYRFEGTVQKALSGKNANLQALNGGKWTTIASGKVSGLGKISMTTTVSGSGVQKWRILVPQQLGASVPVASKTITVARYRILTFNGLGSYRLGMTASELTALGTITYGECGWEPTKAAQRQGISPEMYYPAGGEEAYLGELSLSGKYFKTEAGARVGQKYSEIKALYGSRLVMETKDGNGGPFRAGVVRSGSREIVFMSGWPNPGFANNAPLTNFVLREYSTGMYGGC